MTELDERLDALEEYSIQVGLATASRTDDVATAASTGVMAGFILGVRLALAYPDTARLLAQRSESVRGRTATGVGEAVEVLMGRLVETIGGPE